MEIRTLKTFLLATKLGSFSLTAKQLGYSQSTVTMQIQQLESEIGKPLFDRIGKTIAVTSAGDRLAGYAARILELAEQAKNEAQGEKISGILNIGMAESLCSIYFPRVLKTYHQRYPDVEIVVQRGGHDQMLSKLNQNEIELYYTLGEPIFQKNLIKELNIAEAAYFVCSAAHPLASKEHVTLEDLLQQEFILTEKGMGYQEQLERYLASKNMELTGYLELGDILLIRHLVEENMGLSFLPDYAVHDSIEAGRMQKLLVRGCEIISWRQLVRRREKFVTPQMQAMIDLLLEIEDEA